MISNAQLELWLTKPATRVGITGYQESEDAWCVASSGAWKWGVKDDANMPRLANEAPSVTERISGLMEPTAVEIATNGIKAFSRWLKAGLPVVDEDVFRHRRSVCESCEFWKPDARAGLGKCNHKGCGCTKLKWWLKTEKCPAGKWIA